MEWGGNGFGLIHFDMVVYINEFDIGYPLIRQTAIERVQLKATTLSRRRSIRRRRKRPNSTGGACPRPI